MSYPLPANQVESTLTVAYKEDTSTEFDIASMTNVPTALGYVLVDDGSEWVLKKYAATDVGNKKLQTLSNAGALYESAGAAGHTFPIGTEIWFVQSADYLLALVSATGLRVQDFLYADAPTELTIAGGVITVTQMLHKVDTNGGVDATDDLDTINGGTVAQFLVLRAEHTDRTVVLKHGTGNLELGGSDISLDATDQYVMLLYDATLSKWVMVGGGGGGGGVATDAIWAAAGDLVQGTGANTAAKLAKGSALALLKMNAAGNAVEWGTAGQIAFPAAQASSADPNTQDDYEEGEHVATITCVTSGNYTLNAAKDTLAYTKIGRVVHVQGELEVTGENAPNGMINISLPFAGADLTENAEGAAGNCILWNHGGTIANAVFIAPTPGAVGFLENVSDAGVLQYLDEADVDTAWSIMMSITYIAA